MNKIALEIYNQSTAVIFVMLLSPDRSKYECYPLDIDQNMTDFGLGPDTYVKTCSFTKEFEHDSLLLQYRIQFLYKRKL